ncbi:MAG: hypothetical protein U0Z70_07030 [Thermomicrobiales bacterium]
MTGKRETTFPVRGTPGGWRDPWDDPDDAASMRARAIEAERLTDERVRELAKQMRHEPENEDDEAA